MKANDTLHISNVSPDPLRAGTTFKIGDAEGKILADRGLATEVKSPAKAEVLPQNKAEQPPANKAEPAPANKAETAPRAVKAKD